METSLYKTTGTLAGLVVMMFIVVAMNSLLAAVERRLLSWQPSSRFATTQTQ
jgi:ABC-type nitrate/sulfonate/bicarbonate transport system permease component